MYRITLMVIVPVMLLSACAPSVSSTDVAASITAAAPTLTSTPAPPTLTPSPIPPSPTPTQTPGPTPSGVFGFFDVALEQAGPDTARVTFGYQLEQGLNLNGVQIMAQAKTQGASCNTGRFTVFSRPYQVNGAAVAIVKGDDAPTMSMQDPAKCSFKGFTLMVFGLKGSSPVTLYKQDFDIPFELEKK